MNTKNIFKTLVLAAVLVSACGKHEIADDFKGYALPVTVNVTRQGDEPATRATYNESTRKLSFSTGDKLFVSGRDNNTAGSFKGVLTWVSGGTFSGSINTQNEYTGTADALLTDAPYVTATLLPAGYESYAFLSIEDETDCSGWVSMDLSKAFAPTKKAAVEQFSFEYKSKYSSGFALAPQNAILSFTISGLAANTEVAVLFKEADDTGATPVNVTTDASGVATFAVAVYNNDYIDNYTLTVDGNNIALPTNEVARGHIYNISRSVAPAAARALAEATAEDLGKLAGADGKIYDSKDAASTAGTTAVAMIAYLGSGTDHATYTHGLAIALSDEASTMNWSPAKTTCEGKTAVAGAEWKLPTQIQWKAMFKANGGNEGKYTSLNTAITTAGGTVLQVSGYYWSSTEIDGDYARSVYLDGGDADWIIRDKGYVYRVRACLAF